MLKFSTHLVFNHFSIYETKLDTRLQLPEYKIRSLNWCGTREVRNAHQETWNDLQLQGLFRNFTGVCSCACTFHTIHHTPIHRSLSLHTVSWSLVAFFSKKLFQETHSTSTLKSYRSVSLQRGA